MTVKAPSPPIVGLIGTDSSAVSCSGSPFGKTPSTVTWLLILLSIEFVVRVQERGVTGGMAISVANKLKIFLYLILFGLAVYWASLSHWLYTWDTFVWIAGFAAIEMNISEWRDELLEEQHGTVTAGATT